MGNPQLHLWIDSLNEMFLSRWTGHEQWKYYFYIFKNPTGRRASVREFITRTDMQNLWLYSGLHVSYPKLANLLMHSQGALSEPISSKQENEKNWQFVDLSRLQFTSDESEFIPRLHLGLPWWKNIENLTLHLCQEQLRNWANTENIRIGLVFAVLAQWKFLYCIDRFDHYKG